MEPKKIYQSVTVWFNLLSTILEIIVVLDGVLPPKYLLITTVIKGIVNAILRVWFTSQPIQLP